MPKKEKQRGKGSFVRMCAACNERRQKDLMIRVVRTSEGEAVVDLSGKAPGRGAYVCRNENCVKILRKSGRLSRLLKTAVREEIYEDLLRMTESGDDDG